ncbi:MAG: TonB-dependent receptor, partial [Bacteroidota bacterium]
TDLSSSVSLNALVGYEYQKRDETANATLARDFNVDGDYYNFLQNAQQVFPIVDAEPIQKLSSYFARTIWSIEDKYVLTATVRADGSSKFGSDNRFGVFPSLAGLWNIHQSVDLPLDELKLRVGWGQTGNSEFEAGASQTRWDIAQGDIGIENSANPDLKWETSTTLNLGFDFAAFDYKLIGSIDVFNKLTSDLLFQRQPNSPAPQSLFWENLEGSEVVNRGIEVALNYEAINRSDLKLNIGGNISFLDNELRDYDGANVVYGQVFGQGTSNTTTHRLEEGQPLNAFYLQRFTGFDEGGLSTFANDGAPEYVGDPNQSVIYGFNTQLEYKKLSLNLNFNGALGFDIYNNTLHTVLPITNLGTRNIAESLVTAGEATTNAIQASSRYLESGNYMKLNNATISYNLGSVGTFTDVRFYLTGNNLLVFTGYEGFDPEVNTPNNFDGLPSYGIEYIPYPSARTFLVGVNFSL